MGEIADMHLDGTLCNQCGVLVNEDPPGHEATCKDCKKEQGAHTVKLGKVNKKKKKYKSVKCNIPKE